MDDDRDDITAEIAADLLAAIPEPTDHERDLIRRAAIAATNTLAIGAWLAERAVNPRHSLFKFPRASRRLIADHRRLDSCLTWLDGWGSHRTRRTDGTLASVIRDDRTALVAALVAARATVAAEYHAGHA